MPGCAKRSPPSRSISPANTFSSVDLPPPLRPTRQARSPLPSPTERPAKVGRPPKVTVASRSASSGGSANAASSGKPPRARDAVVGSVDAGELHRRDADELGGQPLRDQQVGVMLAH